MLEIKINGFLPHNEHHEYKIAVFLDYHNQEIQINNVGERQHFNFEYVDRFTKSFGKTVVAKAYGNWECFKRGGKMLQTYGFKLIESYIIRHGKNKKDCTDSQMITDIIELFCKSPKINLYIIISGDIDFLPAVRKLKERKNNYVVIISDKESLNHRYKNFADNVIYYQDLVKMFDFQNRIKRWR